MLFILKKNWKPKVVYFKPELIFSQMLIILDLSGRIVIKS